MKLVVAIIGLILVAAWIEQTISLRAARKRRERDRARESRELAHIVGPRKWWKDPPDDGPESDY